MNFRDGYREIFGEDYKEEKYKFMPHNFKGKVAGKHYCLKCGLVALSNDFSQWSVRMGCLSDTHPQYQSKKKQFTRLGV